MTGFPTMRAAFRTTVSGGGKYEMVFRFPSMDGLHAADDEWRATLATPASDVAPVGEVVSYRAMDLIAEVKVYPNVNGEMPFDISSKLYAHPPHPAPVDPVAGGEGLREALEWYRDQLCEGFCEGFTPRICKAAMEENPTGGDCSGCRAVIALAALKGPAA